MKQISLTCLIFSISMISLIAQNSVTVNINHFLDGQAFELEKSIQNDLGHDFKVRRLQYYLSEFSLIDQNDNEIKIDESFALITTGEGNMTTIELGDIDIETVKSLKFGVGIGKNYNNLDPSQYDADHPLALKVPSMHWGWAGGYRFIVIEGKSSETLDKEMQLHCIGNGNFKFVEIPMNIDAESGAITLNLDAEYRNSLAGIEINQGLIMHGDLNEIVDLVDNFQNNVFTKTGAIVNVQEDLLTSHVSIFPNPSLEGNLRVQLETNHGANTMEVYDLQGKVIKTVPVDSDSFSFLLENQGVHICVFKNVHGIEVARERVIRL